MQKFSLVQLQDNLKNAKRGVAMVEYAVLLALVVSVAAVYLKDYGLNWNIEGVVYRVTRLFSDDNSGIGSNTARGKSSWGVDEYLANLRADDAAKNAIKDAMKNATAWIYNDDKKGSALVWTTEDLSTKNEGDPIKIIGYTNDGGRYIVGYGFVDANKNLAIYAGGNVGTAGNIYYSTGIAANGATAQWTTTNKSGLESALAEYKNYTVPSSVAKANQDKIRYKE